MSQTPTALSQKPTQHGWKGRPTHRSSEIGPIPASPTDRLVTLLLRQPVRHGTRRSRFSLPADFLRGSEPCRTKVAFTAWNRAATRGGRRKAVSQKLTQRDNGLYPTRRSSEKTVLWRLPPGRRPHGHVTVADDIQVGLAAAVEAVSVEYDPLSVGP